MARCFDASMEEIRQIRSPIIQAIAYDRDNVKADQRREVVDWILRGSEGRSQIRLFSFPSLKWRFENELRAATATPVKHIAIERNIHIAKVGKDYIPGRNLRTRMEPVKAGWVHYWQTTEGVLAWSDARSWFSVMSRDIGTQRQRRQYRDKFKRWNAAWLDFHCPIDDGVAFILPRIAGHMSQSDYRVPVAITVQNGREKEPTRSLVQQFRARPKYIRHLLDQSRYRKVSWFKSETYESDTGTSMLTCYAMMDLRAYRGMP